jgi:hypothetical protein
MEDSSLSAYLEVKNTTIFIIPLTQRLRNIMYEILGLSKTNLNPLSIIKYRKQQNQHSKKKLCF